MSAGLSVTGSKNSLQETKNYGQRLINAYETAEYYFGDIGSGVINGEGECIVYIDDIFAECITIEAGYHVFTQKYNGDITTIEKYDSYFTVYGQPGTEFSWELKAKRKGYENHRLEQPDEFGEGRCVNYDDVLARWGETKEDDRLTEILEDELLKDLSLLLMEV